MSHEHIVLDSIQCYAMIEEMPTNACSAHNYGTTLSSLPFTYLSVHTFFPSTLIALNLFNAPLIPDQTIHIELKSHKKYARCAYSEAWMNSFCSLPALIARRNISLRVEKDVECGKSMRSHSKATLNSRKHFSGF